MGVRMKMHKFRIHDVVIITEFCKKSGVVYSIYYMVIRMRATRSHTRNRRSHHALKGKNILSCQKCKEPALPHTACLNCGTYKGREVIDVLKKLSKKDKKKKQKELSQK